MWLHCVAAIIGGARKEADVRSPPLPLMALSVQSVACAIPIIAADRSGSIKQAVTLAFG